MRTYENLWESLRTYENLWESIRIYENPLVIAGMQSYQWHQHWLFICAFLAEPSSEVQFKPVLDSTCLNPGSFLATHSWQRLKRGQIKVCSRADRSWKGVDGRDTKKCLLLRWVTIAPILHIFERWVVHSRLFEWIDGPLARGVGWVRMLW